MVRITINDQQCEVAEGSTIMAAAAGAGVYIPGLCNHPDLPPFERLPAAPRIFRGRTCIEHQPVDADAWRQLEGCGLCVVDVQGRDEPVRACRIAVEDGLSIHTDGPALHALRRDRLKHILGRHPHACLTCAQREGCSLEDCSSNVPKEERCCWKFHHCELRRVAEYVGIQEDTPRYRPATTAIGDDEPLFVRDFELCIDCARCVRVCNQVRGVDALGIVHHNDRLAVGSVGPTLLDSACKFCGACVEVCPTGCLKDKDLPRGEREHTLVPCVHTCPAGADVPGYIRRIAAGDFRAAAALIWETLPLPNVLGHVCFHLCEYECRREAVDESIAICALKRFALQNADGAILGDTLELPDSGRRVAVVGAGPAGLSAAFFLRFKGHAVTVLEAASAAGGMAALSIPDFRLPLAVLQKDLDVLSGLGVEIKTGWRVPTAQAMRELLDQGYDAVLVAVGLPASKRINLPGDDLDGVWWGLDFLRRIKQKEPCTLGDKVIVVGGGNVAIDVAMSAVRLSNAPVDLYCLESRDQMPAHEQEITQAEAEGIRIHNGWGPAEILGRQGGVSGVAFQRCLAVFDDHGKFAPTFDRQDTTAVDADTVILAIGQMLDVDIPSGCERVFLAGDAAGGAAGGSIVDAVASGRHAAVQIDRALDGDGHIAVQLADHDRPDPRIGRHEGFAPQPRVPPPCATPDTRRCDFRQIEGSYSAEQAVAEARRCLQCDLRLWIQPAVLPPEKWLAFSRANAEQVPAVEGVYVLADEHKVPLVIKGTADLQAALLEQLDAGKEARFLLWEQDRMYTKRESELIQQHLQQYGQLPGGGDDELDDLF